MTDREKELVRLLMKLRAWLADDWPGDEEARALVGEIDATVSVPDTIAEQPSRGSFAALWHVRESPEKSNGPKD
jgi:hypothetical protein